MLVGVLGGMGPAATCDFFRKVIAHTHAKKDQDHIRMLISNDPTIPDRTAAILSDGENPLPQLIKNAQLLERAGADVIVMPCNTACSFIPALSRAITCPILSIVECAVDEVAARVSPMSIVGVLATDGTIAMGLYQHALERRGYAAIIPSAAAQCGTMKAIRLVKAGMVDAAARHIQQAVREFTHARAKAIILGCTELPLISLPPSPARIIDATEVYASATVRYATGDRNAPRKEVYHAKSHHSS